MDVGLVNLINSLRWRVTKKNLLLDGQGFIEYQNLAILLVFTAHLFGVDEEVDIIGGNVSRRIIAWVRIRTAPKLGVIHILIVIDIDDLFRRDSRGCGGCGGGGASAIFSMPSTHSVAYGNKRIPPPALNFPQPS